MASKILKLWALPKSTRIADIGGGAGNFARVLVEQFDSVTLVDYEPVANAASFQVVHADLNKHWNLPDATFDALVALEVIEHLENPRHFIREIFRILRPGGYALVSTPNQTSLSSKLCVFFLGQFRDFRGGSYPAHITALLRDDMEKILQECDAREIAFHYSNVARVPFCSLTYQSIIPIGGALFSDNVAVAFRKPSETQ